MVDEITANPEFSEVLRLHNYVQKIKKKHSEVHQQATELRTMFDVLIQKANIGSNNQTKDKRKANDAAGKDAAKKWLGMKKLDLNDADDNHFHCILTLNKTNKKTIV